MKKGERKGTLRERFMTKVTDDWKWTGGKNKDGYGQIKVDGMQMGAHMISYELFNGEIPAGMLVLHSCDDPGCVNPAHLHLGTYKQNSQEASDRGRSSFKKGINNLNATLTDAQVSEIRTLFAAGKHTQAQLGKMFGVHQGTISRMVLRKVRE